MLSDRNIVVDATGHVAGKLAANIAKKLLEGYTITVVACENAVFTGPLERHVGKYMSWKQKRCVVNPQRGAFHYKEPSKYFFKILRTMVQRKSNRGGEALRRLTCYESIPHKFIGVERMMFPTALLKVTTNPERMHCTLGQLLSKFGWKHAEISKEMVEKVSAKEGELNKEKENKQKEMDKITQSAEFQKKVTEELAMLK